MVMTATAAHFFRCRQVSTLTLAREFVAHYQAERRKPR